MARDRYVDLRDKILLLRGRKVMLDADLAEAYGVGTKQLNQQVKRNAKRFPGRYMFRLDAREREEVVAKCDHLKKLRFAPILPRAFTEHGAVMLAGVLNSLRAIETSVAIVDAFVDMSRCIAQDRELAARVARLESRAGKHDQDIKFVLMTLRELMVEPGTPPRKIGFGS